MVEDDMATNWVFSVAWLYFITLLASRRLIAKNVKGIIDLSEVNIPVIFPPFFLGVNCDGFKVGFGCIG